MDILKTFFNNTRKPEGLLGRWMVGSMNHAHAAAADWGMGHLPADAPGRIAELGCGGGRNARELLRRYPASHVTALDYSEISVAKTRRLVQSYLDAGRCSVLQGDVSHLPLEDGQFDLATAFETVYFWPGPAESFREVYRILKPGGLFLIVNESDGMFPRDAWWQATIDGLRIYNKKQLSGFLREAGFSHITVDHAPQKHWLCVLGVK